MTWILIALALVLLWKLGIIEVGFINLSPRHHEVDVDKAKDRENT
jgi:hypothetical protein